MKAARNAITMPKTAEELRLRHRRIGLAWEMARTKHRNRVWLQGGLVEAYRHLSDHVLGKHVYGHSFLEQRPKWELILSYEQEVRKRAYQLLRRGFFFRPTPSWLPPGRSTCFIACCKKELIG